MSATDSASAHSIRQYQPIGGAPVGLWREIHRLYSLYQQMKKEEQEAIESDSQLLSLFETTEKADSAEAWAADLREVLKNAKYCVFRTKNFGETPTYVGVPEEQGLAPTVLTVVGRYGELVQSVWGLKVGANNHSTRPIQWTLRLKAPPPPCDIDPADWDYLLNRVGPG